MKNMLQRFVPRDASVLKIQRESCHPKCARKVSGLLRNGSQVLFSGHGTEATDTDVKAREKSAVKLFATCQLCSVGGR